MAIDARDGRRGRREVDRVNKRKSTATLIRCVPRFGYSDTEVREIELNLPSGADEAELRVVLDRWFEAQGIEEALYDIAVDEDGFYAVINDEAYDDKWGTPLV
jgi:hypothetical protein